MNCSGFAYTGSYIFFLVYGATIARGKIHPHAKDVRFSLSLDPTQ
ncbi:MAG: hypothetical protein Q7J10_05590 [Methanosarcinaceae archaeon]|nr:hypothetical protein [Methanosarcinaceae archaeon]